MDHARCLTLLLAAVAALGGCPRGADPAAGREQELASQPHYGDVMAQIARRFELAGRAAAAGRFELAEFEVDELDELFEDSLPRAALPKQKGAVDLAGVAASFRATHPPELARAAKARDREAFRRAFARAAATCNGCHESTGHAFIEIPTEPGAGVPRLDPVTAAKP